MLVTDYTQKRRGQALLFSFDYNLLYQIWYQSKCDYMDRALHILSEFKLSFWWSKTKAFKLATSLWELQNGLLYNRRPVPSTDQAIPSCFYFRILWILMEQRCFYFFLSPRVSAGPQKPQTLTASKIKYEKFGPKI